MRSASHQTGRSPTRQAVRPWTLTVPVSTLPRVRAFPHVVPNPASMEYLYEYLSFLAKAATVVVAIVARVRRLLRHGLCVAATTRRPPAGDRELNDRLRDMRRSLDHAVLRDAAVQEGPQEQTAKPTSTERRGSDGGRQGCTCWPSKATRRRRPSNACATRSRPC